MLELGGWEHLEIEGEFEQRRVYIFPRSQRQIIRESDHLERLAADGRQTGRVEDGGLLWPAREGPQGNRRAQTQPRFDGFASHHQQRPVPAGGALFKHSWLKYWRVQPQLHRIIEVWDTAYEEGDDNSYSNIDVWALSDLGFVLIDNWHARPPFPELKRMTIWMAAKWEPEVILIEAKASGRSLIQELKRPVPVGGNEPALHASIPIMPIEPEVDKYTRAVAVTPIPEAGLVWLPEKTMPASSTAPLGYMWVADYEKELEMFPAGNLNDRVDTFVHAITYLRGQGSVVDYYRRMQQHARAIEAAEEARAHGRTPPLSNPVLDAYLNSKAMWEELLKRK